MHGHTTITRMTLRTNTALHATSHGTRQPGLEPMDAPLVIGEPSRQPVVGLQLL